MAPSMSIRPQIGQTWSGMDFELEKWELSPGAVPSLASAPVEIGEVTWKGVPTRFYARLLRISPISSGKNWGFVRAQGSDINFVVLDNNNRVSQLVPQLDEKRIKNLRQWISQTDTGDKIQLGRAFHLEGQLCLTVGDRAAWQISEQHERYDFETPFDVQTQPSADFFAWLREQWHDEKSSVRRAWNWNGQSPSQREQYLETLFPRWQKLRQLMRWVACVEAVPLGQKWTLQHTPLRNRSLAIAPQLWVWRDLLALHFLPLNPDSANFPHYINEALRRACDPVTIVVGETSAHEKLEARFLLRDWLRLNAPDQLDLIR